MRQTRRKRTLSNATKEESRGTEQEIGHEHRTKILETTPAEVPEETAQIVWESLKEEYHASIEQLPLSFYRTFSLISEQDKEAQAYYAELFPIMRSYIKLRQSLQENYSGSLPSANESESPDQGAAVDDNTSKSPSSASNLIAKTDRTSSTDATSYRQYHDNDSNISPRRISRIRDATVPKSVPFPPRQKPKSTKELLVRLSFLLSEIMNTLEEKVGLANAAHDSVIRHIKVLDAAIAEHDGPQFAVDAEPGILRNNTTEESSAPKIEQSDDDDEGRHMEIFQRYGQPLPRRLNRRAKEQGGISASTSSDQPPPETSLALGEELYCYCNQVSYGEMVACDNPACEHEWFHLGCVGLSTLPSRRVKWYCPDCVSIMEQNKKRKSH